jgi:UDP-N-acetylglucosamine acyltransferase
MPDIHSTAIICDTAQIGEGTTIGPYTVIGKRVKIGKNNKIGPHCVIENAVMGEGNEVIASAFIGVKPQDLSYDDNMQSAVVIGNKNKIRECVTIHRATNLDKPTTIGDSCLLMANSHVAHDCILHNHIILANSVGVAGHVEIDDGAILSGMVGAHQFVRIGKLAMVSGLSGLPLDVPPFCYATGGRAKLAGINIVGLTRAKFSKEAIRAVKEAYKVLFLSQNTMAESIKILKENNPATEVMELITFCENSKRGIMSARAKGKKTEEDDE